MRSKIQAVAITRVDIAKETLRKGIHLTIAAIPVMAQWNMPVTVSLLCAGILFYVVNETARVIGAVGGPVSRITRAACRPFEEMSFVWGPVTLGIGAMAALLYYPNPAGAMAIYALAFGDGVASLAGRIWGRHPLPYLRGKTLVGSAACFAAVFIAAALYLGDFRRALLTALVATILELIPLGDLDNFVIPLGTGLVLYLIL